MTTVQWTMTLYLVLLLITNIVRIANYKGMPQPPTYFVGLTFGTLCKYGFIFALLYWGGFYL